MSTIPSPTSPNNARDSSPILPFPVSLTDEFPNERAAKRVRTEPASEIDPAITNAVPQLVDQDGRKEDDVVELPRSPERDILSAEESPLFNFLQDGRPRSSAIAPASPRSQSKALLRTYWRLPQATPQTGLMDTESYLVQHYFQDVCTIFSSFDSNLNPFRMSVSRIWTDCKPIKLAIQSMAAGHLANSYPQMASVGVDMQKKASESLKQELNLAIAGKAKPERSLLTLLLLGLSACWHRPNDLGLDYLKAARTLMRNKLLLEALPETKEQQRQDQFFEEALVYWVRNPDMQKSC